MTRLAQRIRDWRREKGLTQVKAAGKLGVSQASLSAWEVGVGVPSLTNVHRMARVMRVPVGVLLVEADDAALQRTAAQ